MADIPPRFGTRRSDMKRIVVALVALVAVTGFALQKPVHAPLPNFDVRTDHAAAVPGTVAPEHAAAVDGLKSRVPLLEVKRSKVLGAPVFFSSRESFLTGPDGQGLAVSEVSAGAFGKNDPHRAVKAFLQENASLFGYGAEVLGTATVSRDYVTAHNGVRTVIWQQELEGIPVYGAILMGHITSRGELVNLYNQLVADVGGAAARGLGGRSVATAPAVTRLGAVDAILAGARNVGAETTARELNSLAAAQSAKRKEAFRSNGALNGDQYAELAWLPLSGNTLRLCWQVIITSRERGEMFLLIVDAESGQVLVRRSLTDHISDVTYNVWTSDSPSPFSPGHQVPSPLQPPVVNRTLVTIPALNITASPNGWIDDGVNETLGNNVDAHADRNDDNQPDLPRPIGNPNRVFNFPIDLATAPANYTTGAVVSLFYWNNFMHDKLYELGFTEAAGNFQTTNFNRGGLGNDAVQADAQDGAGLNDPFHVNNANMATPPDGFPPRMQMYVFDGPTPDRDGDLDAEVILHEYTHGLSNRRVGGGVGISQLQSAGMGEGWSDFYSMSLLSEATDAIDGNYGVGGYVTFNLGGPFLENYYYGIRRFPYTTNLLKNPLTFKDIDPTQASPHTGIPRNPIFGPFTPFDADEVHNQGEVWCVILWELRANLVARYGHTNGNRIALQLVTDAMGFCPPDPNFIESRDAILQADLVNNANAHYNEIWRAFAKRGMGASATSPDSSTTRGVKESYDFPGLAFVSAFATDAFTGNNNAAIDFNECVDVYVTVRNNSVTNHTGIVGLLICTNPGVIISQPTAAYPDMPPTGTAQNLTPFRVTTTPAFVCGSPLNFTLVTTSTSNVPEIRTNSFTLRSGFVSLASTLLNNTTTLPIPDADTNGVDSVINVSGFSGLVGKVTVSLHLTHPFVNDLLLQLIGPDGTTVALSRNQGGGGDNFGTNCTPFGARTTFDDGAFASIALGNAPFVGSFRPDEPLIAFGGKGGTNVNGAWRLRMIDGVQTNTGALVCWTLAISPTVCTDGGGACAADLVLGAAASAPALLGHDLTYTLSVTNLRPIPATAVTLTNVLPTNTVFVSASSVNGTCLFTNGVVRCSFGTIPNGSNVTATIVVQPAVIGSLTNVFAVGGSSAEANPANNVATVVSTVNLPTRVIVADGAQLVGDASGGIEAGETVTVSLALRNTGSAATANLVATLLDGGGVSGSSGSQNYGVIGLGASVARSYTFTAPGQAGDTVTATLQLQDGIENLGTVTFHFTLGGEITFQDGAPIVINQFGPATPYPAIINVSGVAGLVSKVRVTFTKLSHTFPDDIDALLVGPSGQKLVLMSDSGGGNAIANRTITFDDAAGSLLPNETILAAGSYRPGNYDSGTEPGGDVFPAPAPAGPLSSTLAAFNGGSPNGLWSLYIHDDGGNDAGSVSGGWALGISVIVPVIPLSDLSITASAAPNPAIVGEDLTYTLTVANAGPSNAPSVVVTDVIPAGSTFVSAAASQGTASEAAGVVTASLGTINSGAGATVTIVVRPVSTGAQVNQASVSGAVTDLNPANNAVSTSVPANSPVADLALHVTAHPEPVFVSSNVTFHIVVTNQGPNHADAIQVTNRLAGTFALVSATNSQGACSFVDGVITCDFGSLAAHGSATATIVATAVSPGATANLFAIVSPTLDPAPANNVTNVVSVINPLAPLIVPAGVALQSESGVPANGAIESGEVVTVSFGLRNEGTADTGNLVATLLATGGVSSPGGSQNYGALAAYGSTVSRPFSFTASAAPGSTLVATFQLQDGLQDLGTVAFSFNVSASRTFTNSEVIIIPLAGQATNYPSTITVAGVTGAVSKVTVSIRQFTHTFPEDVDMLLVGPAGQKVMLMSDAGAGNGVSGINLTFDDTAVNLPFANTIATGTYRGTDFPPGDTLPAPAPAGPYGTNLAAFNGVNPNGTWSLYVFDDANGDAGRIDGGWTINIQTATPIVSTADISVTATAPATVIPGASFGYTIHVANHGPAAASGVVLTDTLPSGFTLSSVAVSQGSYTTGAGLVTANLGSLAVGATATVAINGSTTVGLTNVLQVTAAPVDGYLANNSVSVVTLLIPPSLAAQLSGADVIISWPAPSMGYVLESSANADGPWAPAGLPITVVGGRNQVTVPAVGTTFYRLAKP